MIPRCHSDRMSTRQAGILTLVCFAAMLLFLAWGCCCPDRISPDNHCVSPSDSVNRPENYPMRGKYPPQ